METKMIIAGDLRALEIVSSAYFFLTDRSSTDDRIASALFWERGHLENNKKRNINFSKVPGNLDTECGC